MTPAQLRLLLAVAQGKISELQMGIQSIDQALGTNLSEEEKAFLSMQRGQLAHAMNDLLEAYKAVEAESPQVVSGG
jgi:hypothetical protein